MDFLCGNYHLKPERFSGAGNSMMNSPAWFDWGGIREKG
jgi:hypothetical protein